LDASGEWHLNSFLGKKNILWMLERPELDESARFFLQMPTLSLMFSVQIGNVLMPNEIIPHCGFPNIHTLPTN
jgi:hypothetical protein